MVVLCLFVLSAIGNAWQYWRRPDCIVVDRSNGRVLVINDRQFGETEVVKMRPDQPGNEDKKHLTGEFVRLLYGVNPATRAADVKSALEMMVPQSAAKFAAYLKEQHVLERQRVKSSHQIARYLVMEIFSTARYFQMRLGDSDSLLRAPLRSLLPARKSPLLSLQVLQRILEMTRILDLFAVRECGETANADVYSNGLSGWRQGFRFGLLAYNQSIPAVNIVVSSELAMACNVSIIVPVGKTL